mmetsp:Transcript_71159/g.230311  ORF Transcript_71159/g.230311 Transcript_71159/m.230311 type:complete len:202 (-) Transcript_71159:473-1078(-)
MSPTRRTLGSSTSSFRSSGTVGAPGEAWWPASMKSARSRLPECTSRCWGTRMRWGAAGSRGRSRGASSGASWAPGPRGPWVFSLASLRICRSSDGVTTSVVACATGAGLLPLSLSSSARTDIGVGAPPLQAMRCISLKSFFTSSLPFRWCECRPSAAVSTSIFRTCWFCTACINVPVLTANSQVKQYSSLWSRSGRGGLRL